MNPFWTKVVIRTVLRNKRRSTGNKSAYSGFVVAKGFRELKINVTRYIRDFLLIAAGIFSAAFGFKGFLLTNRFIDGGATGISLLISALTSIPLALLIVCINIPFIILGYNVIGKHFAIKAMLAITGLAVELA